MKTFEPGRNPGLDDAGTHVATNRLYVAGGRLHQYWVPADWELHAPEWRPVEEDTAEPVPQDPPA